MTLSKLSMAVLGIACAGVVAAAAPPSAHGLDLFAADALRAPFELRWGEELSRLRIVTTSVVAGETVRIEALDRAGNALPAVVNGADGIERDGLLGFRFAPRAAPALYTLNVRVPGVNESIRLNVFTVVSNRRVRNGRLNGYRIGAYPARATVQGALLTPPAGFIEVTEQNVSTRVTPRFTLGQFLCKQEGGFPKYLVLNDRLPLKLEALINRLGTEGLTVPTLHVMSGYRTPAYNAILQNVNYSRHLWGAAADVFVDVAPEDGVMDDLNGDGRVNPADADWLARVAESLESGAVELVGGVGRYAATPAHGPFVHVDVRAHAARW